MKEQKTITEVRVERVLKELGFEVYCEGGMCNAHKNRDGLPDIYEFEFNDYSIAVKRVDHEKSDSIDGLKEDCAEKYTDDNEIDACVEKKIEKMLKKWNTAEELIGHISIDGTQIKLVKRYEAKVTDIDVTVYEVIAAKGDGVKKYIEPLLAFMYYHLIS